MPLAVARETTRLFLGAGLVGLVGLRVRGKLDLRRLFWRWPRALAAAALACAAVAGLLTPLGVVAHRLALTSERAASATLLALLLLPLFLCLEVSLRRGSSGAAALGASRNVLAIAALESAWLAWFQAASLPILW